MKEQAAISTRKGPTGERSEDVHNDLEKYRALIKASNIGAWEYFPETELVSFNDIYFSMLGRDINDNNSAGDNNTIQNVWLNLLHPEDKQAAIERFNAYVKNPHGIYDSHFRMGHADGSWRWIWARGNVLEGENSTRTIIGTHVDITQHKEAEDIIQQERILLRTLIDSLPDIIYVKDDAGRKIIANRADVKSLGAKLEAEVIGKTDIELFPNEIGLRGYEDDMSVLKEGTSILDKEEFFIEADGAKRWIVTSKIPVLDENGKVVRLLGIGHNITERKKSEETLNILNHDLLEQSEELRALNEQLTQQKEQELEKAIAQGKFEIASEVLHDIGNALVGFGAYLNRINRAMELNNLDTVKSLAQFLKGQQAKIAGVIGEDKAGALVTITEGISKTQTDNQEEITAAIKELMNIIAHIQEILNIQRQFVKGHSGAHERKPVNLANLVDNCRSMLYASFDKKGIQLRVDIPHGPYIIKGDHTKLMQVILNVLKNSIEAINMDAAEKKISIAIDADDNAIELTVIDNGIGFTPEIGSRFFERGFTTKKTGTGLGLYNCKTIVESHGGSFKIQSNGVGLGAVTTIRLDI